MRKILKERHKSMHLNSLSKAGNFLKCSRVRKIHREANGSSDGSSTSRCNSFFAYLILLFAEGTS